MRILKNLRELTADSPERISKDLLARVDWLTGSKPSRPAFIERVLRKYLRDRRRARTHARDLELLNPAADRLNRAEEVLEYQVTLYNKL